MALRLRLRGIGVNPAPGQPLALTGFMMALAGGVVNRPDLHCTNGHSEHVPAPRATLLYGQ
jgi:hypothetical protein